MASDCASGTFCVDDGTEAACVTKDTSCEQGTCISPLACASDHRCRNTCSVTADCNVLGSTGRVCAVDANDVGFCADPGDVSGGEIVAPPPPGASTMPVAAPDASAEAATVVYASNDAGTGPLPHDETTGLPCTSDGVCRNPNGPGVNECSSDFTVSFYGTYVQLWSTPVCVIPPSPVGNCVPGIDPDVRFCDGPADDPSSPGVCIALDPSDPSAGMCVPKCTFAADGSQATGCVGHDVCGYLTDLFDIARQMPLGIGFCTSNCVTDADCAELGPDYKCQADVAHCTLTPVQRTKTFGDPCSTAGNANDQTSGACLCANGSDGSGFCTTECVVGGPACPNGWVCESGEPNALAFGSADGGTSFSLTAPTPGLLGNCIPACTAAEAEAGAGGDTGACPAGSACTADTVAGPDCLRLE
jgi:hypothetical protein